MACQGSTRSEGSTYPASLPAKITGTSFAPVDGAMRDRAGHRVSRYHASDLLRTVVHVALTDGRLANVNGHVAAGTGSGRACAVCSAAVSAREVEYEVASPQGAVAAHFPCYLVWHQESKAQRMRL